LNSGPHVWGVQFNNREGGKKEKQWTNLLHPVSVPAVLSVLPSSVCPSCFFCPSLALIPVDTHTDSHSDLFHVWPPSAPDCYPKHAACHHLQVPSALWMSSCPGTVNDHHSPKCYFFLYPPHGLCLSMWHLYYYYFIFVFLISIC
jgi:hypothetical protein